MALYTCKKCGKQVPVEYAVCPFCGTPRPEPEEEEEPKRKKKKKHPILGTLLLIIGITIIVSVFGGDKEEGPAKAEGASSSQSTPRKEKSNAKETISDYEITYQDSTIYKNALGEISCYAIVEVKNTGSVDLYLKDATFDFEDKDGHLLATYSTLISSDPSIIAPGENGYFYCNSASLSGDINTDSDYVFKPNIKVEKAKNEIVRYEISDLSISDGGLASKVEIIGRVTNNTSEDDDLLWISCILYRDDGTPIAAYGTNVLDLGAGDSQSFSASGLFLTDLDFEYSDIADYKIYAAKTQLQF